VGKCSDDGSLEIWKKLGDLDMMRVKVKLLISVGNCSERKITMRVSGNLNMFVIAETKRIVYIFIVSAMTQTLSYYNRLLLENIIESRCSYY
jgi:hypothetical protein